MVAFSARRIFFTFKLGLLIGLVGALTGGASALDYGNYQRISVSEDGAEANEASNYGVMSADGNLILFESYATNLTDEVTDGLLLYNRQADTLEQLTQIGFFGLRWGATGRYLLYETGSSLTTSRRVWLRDLDMDTDEMVSVDTGGGEPNHGSTSIGISADGRYAVFASYATDLVGSMTGCNQLFVRDTLNDTTVCVPMALGQDIAYNYGTSAAILSEDGSKLYYGAPATVCCVAEELFVYDTALQTSTFIDITFDDEPATYGITVYDVSDDGTVVVFTSWGNENIVPGVHGSHVLYMYDSGTSSVTAWDALEQGLVDSTEYKTAEPRAISGDGRYVWGSLVHFVEIPIYEYGVFNFVYDRQLDITTPILQTGNNPMTGDLTFIEDVSADGSVIAFSSEETTLVPDDTNGFRDIFLATLQSEPTVTELLVNGNFEDNDNADVLLPDGWKKVGLLTQDRVKSDTVSKTFAHSAPNAFQIQGTKGEVGKVSKLSRNAKVNGVSFTAGDTLTFSAMVDQRTGIPGTPIAKALVKYKNGSQQAMTLKLPNPKVVGYGKITVSKALNRGDVKTIIVDVFYGNAMGKFYIDDVSLTHTASASAPMLAPLRLPSAP